MSARAVEASRAGRGSGGAVTEPVFPFWILRGLGDEPLHVQPFDAPRPPHYQLLPPMFPIGYLRQWLYEPDARRVLLEIYATLFGALRLTAWSYDEVALAVGPALTTAFARGDLIVLTPWRANAGPPGKREEPTAPPPVVVQEKTWIEVELFDGVHPVPGESVTITPQGGAPISRVLDAEGFTHVDGLDPGTCKVDFPGIDAREWGRHIVFRIEEAGATSTLVGADEAHTVLQGEDLFIIAKRFDFRNWQTIYRHAANAAFRALRPKPEILFPGDQLTIPGKRRKDEPAATGATHRFYIHPPTRSLLLRLRDTQRKPIALEPYQLFIDGSLLSGKKSTGADGELDEEIPLDARGGSLVLADYTWTLDIAALNPMDQTPDDGVSGAQGRLRNLGYDVGPIDGVLGRQTADALRRFKAENPGPGLGVDGQLDQATKDALVRVHGS